VVEQHLEAVAVRDVRIVRFQAELVDEKLRGIYIVYFKIYCY
jgi:hypothetical protein